MRKKNNKVFFSIFSQLHYLALLASDPEQCNEPLDLSGIQSGTPAFAIRRIPEEAKQSKPRLRRPLRQSEVVHEHDESRLISYFFSYRIQRCFW